jgi:hypothetical protein
LYSRFFRAFSPGRLRRAVYLLGGLLIVVLQCSPMPGSYLINFTCYLGNQEKSRPMIAALETYHQDQGHYPETLTALVPTYLPALPTPACNTLSGNQQKPQFALVHCSPEETLVTVFSVDGSSIQRYSFATGNWSSISFFDGACSFLR